VAGYVWAKIVQERYMGMFGRIVGENVGTVSGECSGKNVGEYLKKWPR